MNRIYDVIRKFYRLSKWKMARAIKINTANVICERCGSGGAEIHNIVHLTLENIIDANITLN